MRGSAVLKFLKKLPEFCDVRLFALAVYHIIGIFSILNKVKALLCVRGKLCLL